MDDKGIGRFLIFAGEEYYAAGGWCDFVTAKHDRTEAVAEAESQLGRSGVEWVQVVDSVTGSPVRSVGYAHGGHELRDAASYDVKESGS